MKVKRLISTLTAAALLLALPLAVPDAFGTELKADGASAEDVTKYTYTVTPLLKPFNEYYFVKTDNPDPFSFRFLDSSTVYGSDSDKTGNITYDYDDWNEKVYNYSDIKYENAETGRVNGGYIFKGSATDGGKLTLQYREGTKWWNYEWHDTEKTYTVPKAKNYIDYLIDTYATKDGFFENMDAVQSGLSSICFYSGSYIRGELTRPEEYWALSNSPHKDQLFYIQSPYSRKDNKKLFVSYLYPYFADSLGFPSILSTIAKKLDPNCTVSWDSYSHSRFSLTHDGTTKTYGGQGIGEGQAITEDKILHKFTFNGKDSYINNFSGLAQLLRDYAKLEIADDFQADDELDFKSIFDTVGKGSWVRIMLLTSIFGGTSYGYTYLYQNGDGSYFWDEDINTTGAKIYWGGNLGSFTNAWIDGRYINFNECYIPGVTLEDTLDKEKYPTTPTATLLNTSIYEVTATQKYKTELWDDGYYHYIYYYEDPVPKKVKKAVRYTYDPDDGLWYGSIQGSSALSYSNIKQLVDEGKLDKKYLNNYVLTTKQLKALGVDKNTNREPMSGFIYDRKAAAGTPFKYLLGDLNRDDKVNMLDYAQLQKLLLDTDAGWRQFADLNADDTVNMLDYALMQKYLLGSIELN